MGAEKKKAAPERTASKGNTSAANHSDNTATAQRDRLLTALRTGPITTLGARRELDVLHPGARIMELRKLGHRIATIWTMDLTSEGKPHRVAKYVLQPGGAA